MDCTRPSPAVTGNCNRPMAGIPNSMTPEETVRAYSTWAAYASFLEKETGVIAHGRWADLTVMDIDPLSVGAADPGKLLKGNIRMTIVGGKIVYSTTPSF